MPPNFFCLPQINSCSSNQTHVVPPPLGSPPGAARLLAFTSHLSLPSPARIQRASNRLPTALQHYPLAVSVLQAGLWPLQHRWGLRFVIPLPQPSPVPSMERAGAKAWAENDRGADLGPPGTQLAKGLSRLGSRVGSRVGSEKALADP